MKSLITNCVGSCSFGSGIVFSSLKHESIWSRMVKDFIISSKPDQIAKLIRVLEEFAMSHNPHTRKGGLIGLAAVAIGLGTKVILFYFCS